jgi:RNA polymerase sigma-70 factor (sigma-E family)
VLGLLTKSERDAAFTGFVDDATASLTRTAWLLTGNDERAADLVQAALVKTYLNWAKVRHGEALAYARRILINEHTDRWRRTRNEVLGDDPLQASADSTAGVDDRDRIARMLATLPAQQRTIVVLRYYNDLSEAQVADLLHVSVGSVKSAASRGLATLRAHYAPASREGDL